MFERATVIAFCGPSMPTMEALNFPSFNSISAIGLLFAATRSDVCRSISSYSLLFSTSLSSRRHCAASSSLVAGCRSIVRWPLIAIARARTDETDRPDRADADDHAALDRRLQGEHRGEGEDQDADDDEGDRTGLLRQEQHDPRERVDHHGHADRAEQRHLQRMEDALAQRGVVRLVGRGPLAPRLDQPLDQRGQHDDDAGLEHDRLGERARGRCRRCRDRRSPATRRARPAASPPPRRWRRPVPRPARCSRGRTC